MPNLINLSDFIGAGSVDQVMLSLQRHTCSHTFFTAVIFSTLSFCFGPICLFTFCLWPICPAVFCWICVLNTFFKIQVFSLVWLLPHFPQHHMIHLICKLVKTEHAVVINTKCDCCFWPHALFFSIFCFCQFVCLRSLRFLLLANVVDGSQHTISVWRHFLFHAPTFCLLHNVAHRP